MYSIQMQVNLEINARASSSVRRRMNKNVLDHKAISDIICLLIVKDTYRKITFLNVHALTEDKEIMEKEFLWVRQMVQQNPKIRYKNSNW